jgi:hypothetical protein
VENNLPLTDICRTSDDVATIIKKYSIGAVIIGSDAVLQHKTFFSRINITKRGLKIKEKRTNVIFPNPFWGSFIPLLDKKIPVAIMSASSQNMPFRLIYGKLKKDIGKALLKFDLITVRDEWTKEMVMHFTANKVHPSITPDPVFGYNQNITQQDSKAEILKKFNLPEKYFLFSFKHKNIVTEAWLKEFQTLLVAENIEPVLLTMPGGIVFSNPPFKVIAHPLSPTDWYSLIKFSSGYVGENFHPTVVALHNSVPFFIFDDYGIARFRYFIHEKSSKIYNLLNQGGFLKYRISTLGKVFTPPLPRTIFDSMKDFDFVECEKFSNQQLSDYNKMMSNIIKYISIGN